MHYNYTPVQKTDVKYFKKVLNKLCVTLYIYSINTNFISIII